jgi:hypothetical protein
MADEEEPEPMPELSQELKAELKAELMEELKAGLMEELKAELKSELQHELKPEPEPEKKVPVYWKGVYEEGYEETGYIESWKECNRRLDAEKALLPPVEKGPLLVKVMSSLKEITALDIGIIALWIVLLVGLFGFGMIHPGLGLGWAMAVFHGAIKPLNKKLG